MQFTNAFLAGLAAIAGLTLLSACGGGGGGGSQPGPNPPPVAPPANRAPVATPASYNTDQSTRLDGTLAATDADGDTLNFSLENGPQDGTLTLSGSSNADFAYEPNPGFNGEDSFTFTASDGTATSASAMIKIRVNSKPQIGGASYSTVDIVAVEGQVTASDEEGDPLTFSIATQPASGTVEITDPVTGSFTYTPVEGVDAVVSFTVTAADEYQSSVPATVNVNVMGWQGTQQWGTPADDAPLTQSLVIDDSGIWVGGETAGALGGTNAGDDDEFLTHFGIRGGFEWTQQTGTTGRDFVRTVLDSLVDDNVYVITGRDIRRLNREGQVIWSRTPAYAGNVLVYGYRAVVDADSNLYITHLPDPGTDNLAVIEKYQGWTGDLVWSRTFAPSSVDPLTPWIADSDIIWIRGLAVDADGNLVVSGNTQGGTMTACDSCGFVAKLDADGNDLWVRTAIGPGTPACNSPHLRLYRPTVAADGSIFVNGIAMEPGMEQDFVLMKFNADGEFLWEQCEVSNYGDAWAFTEGELTAEGDIVSLYEQVSADESGVILLTRHDADGNRLWLRELRAQTSAGAAAVFQHGDLAIDEYGVIYITGATNGDLDGNVNAGGKDAFLMRLDAEGNPR